MPEIKAVVFDLDGLMIDTEPLAQEAWDIVLRGYGHRLKTSVFDRMIGLRLTESSVVLKESYGLEVSPEELVEQEGRAMYQIIERGIPTMPGMFRLLSELDRRQMPWAVATSSFREYAIDVMGRLDLLERCEAIAAGDEVEHGKPQPDVYLLAAERLGIDPTHCMALEDSPPGVNAAAAAGMMALAVPNGDTSLMDFQQAAHVYLSLNEVADDLQKLLS
jgi:HAD superfamily hydrolase (TIGR01509 family)